MFIPSTERSALLGCIKEVGYNCVFASLVRGNDARRNNEEALKSKLYRSVINLRIIAD